jgi:ADP-ribosyl-[dinitrogen reductase] hydrolase
MRLAPVAIRHWRDRDELQRLAALQTRTTQGSPATLAASTLFASMLADASAGTTLPELLACRAAMGIEGLAGAALGRHPWLGIVVRSLQTLVWAVSRD